MLRDTIQDGLQRGIAVVAVAIIVVVGAAIVWWLGADDFDLCRADGFSWLYCYRMVWGD